MGINSISRGTCYELMPVNVENVFVEVEDVWILNCRDPRFTLQVFVERHTLVRVGPSTAIEIDKVFAGLLPPDLCQYSLWLVMVMELFSLSILNADGNGVKAVFV